MEKEQLDFDSSKISGLRDPAVLENLKKAQSTIFAYMNIIKNALKEPSTFSMVASSSVLTQILSCKVREKDLLKALHLKLKLLKGIYKSYGNLISLIGNDESKSGLSVDKIYLHITIGAESALALIEFCQYTKDYPNLTEKTAILNPYFLDMTFFKPEYRHQPIDQWPVSSVSHFALKDN